MLETAACAEAHDGGESETGRGYTRRWRALYANAEVEEEVDEERRETSGFEVVVVAARRARVSNAREEDIVIVVLG